uniref:Uncharacterized protein n=2 Tax=Cacopsylla melanoneura TaxID=428564 RepID=A0A8D8VM47_9HEMI
MSLCFSNHCCCYSCFCLLSVCCVVGKCRKCCVHFCADLKERNMNSPKPNEKNISRTHSNKSSKSSNNNDYSDGEELTPVSGLTTIHFIAIIVFVLEAIEL